MSNFLGKEDYLLPVGQLLRDTMIGVLVYSWTSGYRCSVRVPQSFRLLVTATQPNIDIILRARDVGDDNINGSGRSPFENCDYIPSPSAPLT